MIKHICGQCTKNFSNEEEYLIHKCPVSGITPKSSTTMIYKNQLTTPLEKKILNAVYVARQEKRDKNE